MGVAQAKRVIKRIICIYISSRATLNETLTAK